MTLGEKIQQLRKATGISQEQLADQLDVSRQSISKWELNESIPEIGKIILLSELFSISTDELLKNNSMQSVDEAGTKKVTITLEEITRRNTANKRVALGFKTIVTGLIMLVLELMFLPVFGAMQKAHVDGQGFYTDIIRYAGMQPMPMIFVITVAIVLLGVVLFVIGLCSKRHNTAK